MTALARQHRRRTIVARQQLTVLVLALTFLAGTWHYGGWSIRLIIATALGAAATCEWRDR